MFKNIYIYKKYLYIYNILYIKHMYTVLHIDINFYFGSNQLRIFMPPKWHKKKVYNKKTQALPDQSIQMDPGWTPPPDGCVQGTDSRALQRRNTLQRSINRVDFCGVKKNPTVSNEKPEGRIQNQSSISEANLRGVSYNKKEIMRCCQ